MDIVIEYKEFMGRKIVLIGEGENDQFPLWLNKKNARLLGTILKQRPDFLETFEEDYPRLTKTG